MRLRGRTACTNAHTDRVGASRDKRTSTAKKAVGCSSVCAHVITIRNESNPSPSPPSNANHGSCLHKHIGLVQLDATLCRLCWILDACQRRICHGTTWPLSSCAQCSSDGSDPAITTDRRALRHLRLQRLQLAVRDVGRVADQPAALPSQFAKLRTPATLLHSDELIKTQPLRVEACVLQRSGGYVHGSHRAHVWGNVGMRFQTSSIGVQSAFRSANGPLLCVHVFQQARDAACQRPCKSKE